jgi:two-component system cell cycle sensor histidine kinase/response regulator CckA
MSQTVKRAVIETAPLRLLIVDDDRADVDLCIRDLKKSGINFIALTTSTREDFTLKLRENSIDVVIADYRMKSWTGMDALEVVKEVAPGVPVILLSGTVGEELAVDCIKMGITDYVLKHQRARLPMALRRANEERALRDAETNAVKALRESEERYRTLVENAPEAIVVLDVETGTFVDCNDNALRLFRITRSELLSRGNADFAPAMQPDGRGSSQEFGEHIAAAVAGGRPCFEWIYRNTQGDEIPCEVHLASLPSTTRRLVRGSILDIRERKRAEAALRESEKRYRSLVENAIYGIYWANLDGQLLYVNSALARMLGYESASELLTVSNTKNLYEDHLVRDRLVAEYLRNHRLDTTVDWKRKDQKAITVRLNARDSHDPETGNECIEVMVEDVTERLALEKKLNNAQKFEAIGQLAGGIAHDFNNMIGAIIGWADIGFDEAPSDSRLRRHFEKVRQQAERAAALTRQLLAFARRQILDPRDIDLNQSVVETLSLLEKVIGSNIEIEANLASDLALVRADPTQVEQILMNLCINARDAMPGGGVLTIRTANVAVDPGFCRSRAAAHPGQYVVMTVADNGTGMDQTTLDHIFEPFFTTKALGKGTGLGLPTVYGIAQQHGGFIDVRSELNRGSTFETYLPISTAPAEVRKPVEERKVSKGGSETILVAEDHEGLRQLALETLSKLGYNVLTVADGQQAIEAFRNNRTGINLLLLDIVMPKVNGSEVYAQISLDRGDLPVIFATGYSADSALLGTLRERGLPMLQKPYSPHDLARKVREVLDGQVHSSPSN